MNVDYSVNHVRSAYNLSNRALDFAKKDYDYDSAKHVVDGIRKLARVLSRDRKYDARLAQHITHVATITGMIIGELEKC